MMQAAWLLAAFAARGAPADDACNPARITAFDDAGCGRYFPRFHPKNAKPLAHNNDANAPFEFGGVHHLFMQAIFPGVPGYIGSGSVGLGHLASRDTATWTVIAPALVPGRYGGRMGRVGEPAGNATEGYYSGSATIVGGTPRIIVPAVFFPTSANHTCPVSCADRDSWHCMLDTPKLRETCAMTYTTSSPLNLSDPLLTEWSPPTCIVDGRVDGVQPHGPSFDDTTHAWQDQEDLAAGRDTWRFAGQTTVCVTNGCDNHSAGDRPTYLQLFASRNGSDWTAGFDALGDLFSFEPDGEPDAGIMNSPDFWKREDSRLGPVDLLHFGSNAYWLGNYTRRGDGAGQTAFVPSTPQQQFGPGAEEGKGYYSAQLGKFLWWGWIESGAAPAEPGVPAWDSALSVARVVEYDPGLSTAGDFNGMLTFRPVDALLGLRVDPPLVSAADAWPMHTVGATETVATEMAAGEAETTEALSAGADGLLALPNASGNCLDIELNVTWHWLNGSAAAVPPDFGAVGVSVLGAAQGRGNGTELVITSGDAGALAMGSAPLAPSGSARPRPAALSLRVLVDRSVVEAFAQGGRATSASMHFPPADHVHTALVWRPSQSRSQSRSQSQSQSATAAGPEQPVPRFALRVWAMRTGFAETL